MPHVLSLVVWMPLVGALAVAAWPASLERLVRPVAAAWAVAVFGATLLLARADAAAGGLQWVEDHAWIPSLGARYSLGVDALSTLLAIATALAVAAAISGATRAPARDPRSFFALLLTLETALLGGLVSVDCLLLLAFWSFALVPAYLLVVGWGGERAASAANGLFVTGAAGCAATLVALALLYARTVDPATLASLSAIEAVSGRLAGPSEAASGMLAASLDSVRAGTGTFDLPVLWAVAAGRHGEGGPLVPAKTQAAIFALLLFGAAVRGAVFPFHGWLREAVAETPPAVAAISGAFVNLGVFGLVRLALPLAPDVARDGRVSGTIAAVAAVGVVWSALVALASPDDPHRVASAWSVASSSLVAFACATSDPTGIAGSVLAAASRAVVVAAFVVAAPTLAPRGRAAFAAAAVALVAAGLPPFAGFVASALSLAGAREGATWCVVVGSVALGVLAAVLLRIALSFASRRSRESADALGPAAWTSLVVLLLASVAIGVAPGPLLARLARPAYALANQVWHVEGQPDRYAATPEDQERLVRERADKLAEPAAPAAPDASPEAP